jgi:serine protease AprX
MTSKLKAAIALVLITVSALSLRGSGAEHRALLSTDLLDHQVRRTTARARVIVHGDEATVDAVAYRHHLQIVRRLAGGAVLAANSSELTSLAADASIDHLSGDIPVRTWMSVSNKSTGADQVRTGTSGLLLGIGGIPAVNGQGVGVAVIDSGISSHPALTGRVVANVSFVSGDPIVSDPFGHGTHIAGIIAGNASAARTVTPLYTGGIAPGSNLVNVRVLGVDGSGLTSDVIAGIDWAIANRTRYNIRVINLSLGHPVFEPAATDPLCEAVKRAYDAGIVVVVAAGNSGKSAEGHMVLGSITSPGNSPYALTVGAMNTWGTVGRADDSVTTYSSRGPTRFDLAVKPDVAAPGNKIVSLEAAGSFLATFYPSLHRAGTAANAYMQLSGTSMAAPMVSGAVATMLQGRPGLSPAQVKFELQNGATYVNKGGLLGAGAGSVNFWSTRQNLSKGLLGGLVDALIGGLLARPSGASFWDNGALGNRLYSGSGIRLLSLGDAVQASSNPALLHFGELNLVGLTNPLASIPPKWMMYGEIGDWTGKQTILWGDTIYDPQGQTILWGDNTTQDTTILWGDSMTASDPR